MARQAVHADRDGDGGPAGGEFLEVVNLNLLGSQYAIAGTVAGLDALESEIERRRAEFGGKRAFILVPGIDVPFHSAVLRTGVPEIVYGASKTPEQIVEKLTALRDLGMDYGIFYFPEIATDTSGLELFEREVVPALS